jgi:hypothetical protein
MDSTEALFGSLLGRRKAHKYMKKGSLSMVARDGIAQHYGALTIPLIGVHLYPALELR